MAYWKTGITISCLLVIGGAGCFNPYETMTVENPAKNLATHTNAIIVPAIISTGGKIQKETDPFLRSEEDQNSQITLFKTTDNAFYFRRIPIGLGGYIIFDVIPTPLIRLDRVTGQKTVVLGTKNAVMQDVSADDTLIAFTLGKSASDQLSDVVPGISIFHQASSTEKFYPITMTPPFTEIGMVTFSPDASQVAFAAAANNPEHEQGAVYTLNLENGKVTEIAKTKPKENRFLTIKGWKNNKDVLFE